MSEYNDATIAQQSNSYFDGKVTSRAITLADGIPRTLGVMQPGEYQFGTEKRELMEILTGSMAVLLPGETLWQTITGGQSFNVPADSSFKVNVSEMADYCCSYLD